MKTRLALLLLLIPVLIPAQMLPPALNWEGRLRYHAWSAGRPIALVGVVAYAGYMQETNSPREWGQGGAAYGKRVASTASWSVVHGTLAFGLDSALHQDPRYFRSDRTGFWRRTGHALRGTILTRTDSGGETLSTWRIGSDYGSAFISNLWYPDRLNTPGLAFKQGSVALAFDFATNLQSEFWPDIKAKVFRRK